MREAFYLANYDLLHKATQTIFSTNCNAVQQRSFLKSHFSSFAIKQHRNSWKLRWVNSTILNNKIWLVKWVNDGTKITKLSVTFHGSFTTMWHLFNPRMQNFIDKFCVPSTVYGSLYMRNYHKTKSHNYHFDWGNVGTY